MSRLGIMVVVWMAAAAGGLAAAGTDPRGLDMETRVSAQAAIEGVYWRHRIWPSENAGPKPPLDHVVPESALRAEVEDSMLESKALERLWGRPIRAEDLRTEVERMMASSRAPDVLQEIFAALGNDPVLINECLARPLVADRLIRDAYAHDPRYHLAQKTAIEQSLVRHPTIAEHRGGSGYTEAVWVLGGGRAGAARGPAGARVIPMDAESWRRNVARLEAGFEPGAQDSTRRTLSGSTSAQDDPRAGDLPIGILGNLREDDESFFVQAVLEQDDARLRVATVAWRKTPFDEWWARAKTSLDSGPTAGSATVGVDALITAQPLPSSTGAGCSPDTWAALQNVGAPSPREALTAVWTGAEMIVWGGYNGSSNLDTNSGGRYTPATDSWTPTSTTGAPEARDSHTAVWTGTKMVVWGGGNEVYVPKDTGGRYDPATNSWLPTKSTGAPTGRLYHTAVWTGARMVVWGGWTGSRVTDTGALYDPAADAWSATARQGSPGARDTHTAIWSGTRMVVWGGEDDNAIAQNTGARYDPVANSWSATATTGVPAARWLHSAVWTGSRMIVWGGYDGAIDLATGALYDPTANTWLPTSTAGTPVPRERHLAVWVDAMSEMVVWGGQDDAVKQLNSGARYNPATDTWATTSTVGAPTCGRFGSVAWTGSEMIVWGGWNLVDLDSGGRYCVGACTSLLPAGSSTIVVSSEAGGGLVSWSAVPGAEAYDLVRGSIAQLVASGGDFTTSTQACLADDDAGTSYLDADQPPVGNGFWYLVRGQGCGGTGTYDSVGGSQVGSRDSSINASSNSCP